MEELVEEAVANGDKVLIFSNWTEMTDPALKRLAKYNPASITGKIKDADKKEQERKFMTDPTCKVIVGTTGAMGTGYTLTAGATVIFLDSPWTKAAKDQAEDRAHRIGTKSNVSIITLVCKDTIDEYIEEIVEGKGELSDALVDGKITPSTMKLFQNMLRAI
jgi:SNF2 family DNA or RNA helicase